MSEYPEWVERQLGWSTMTPEEGLELHRKLAIVYELIPDIEQRMEIEVFSRKWPWWKRYLWYVQHG